MRFTKRILKVGEIEAVNGRITITPAWLKRLEKEFNSTWVTPRDAASRGIECKYRGC